ncbi:MAG: rRNA maturation RNase YbeY [Rhodobacteraceae bacterium]|nr:rRNA maturation RNase YbeY [Paracoccaceae bacterium]
MNSPLPDAANLVDLLIEDARWHATGLEALAEAAASATLRDQGLGLGGFEIALLACDDARIAALNADFRDKPSATNVLSWPAWDLAAPEDGAPPDLPESGAPDDPEALGDIALAYDTCLREAKAQGKPLSDHLTHLIVHAVLHLLGYDHIRDKDAALMEETEIRILATLGVDNPYEGFGSDD